MNIAELEEAFDRQLQKPRVTGFAAARAAAVAWSEAVWSMAESVGPVGLADGEIEHAFAVARRPVFVFGAHRSGTTLTRDLLDHHPALSVLPAEGTMFTNPTHTLSGRDRERVTALVADTAGKLGYELAPLPAPRRNLLRMLLLARRMADRIGSRWPRLLPSPTRPS